MKSNWVRAGAAGALTMLALGLAVGCTQTITTGTLPEPPAVSEPPTTTPEPEPGGTHEQNSPGLGRPEFETPDIILRCGEHQMSGNIFSDRVELALDGGDYVLERIEAEDGNMFSDGNFTLWNTDYYWGFMDAAAEETFECDVAAIGG